MVAEIITGFRNGHVKDIRNILALIMDLKRIPIISRAPTDFTGDIDIGKEIHFNFQHAVTMAGLAAAALYIKAEAAWFIAPNLGFIRRCKRARMRSKVPV